MTTLNIDIKAIDAQLTLIKKIEHFGNVLYDFYFGTNEIPESVKNVMCSGFEQRYPDGTTHRRVSIATELVASNPYNDQRMLKKCKEAKDIVEQLLIKIGGETTSNNHRSH